MSSLVILAVLMAVLLKVTVIAAVVRARQRRRRARIVLAPGQLDPKWIRMPRAL